MSDQIAALIDANPLILPEDKEKCKNYFLQRPPELDKWFFSTPDKDFLRQGDIISNCTFLSVMKNEKGEDYIDVIEDKPGILLNSTCDMSEEQSRGENLLIAPILGFDYFLNDPPKAVPSFEKWAEFLGRARASRTSDFLFLPPTNGIDESLVPLYRTTAINLEAVYEKIKSGEMELLASVTRIGWYFFITKLSDYFVRFEDQEEVGRAQE